ncbi:MAG: hypothetical protein ACRCTA_00705, partial [Bacilli bacterium]
LYNFYIIRFNYDRGLFGFVLLYSNEFGCSILIDQRSYEDASLDICVKNLDDEIRLRIPDKYLEKYDKVDRY